MSELTTARASIATAEPLDHRQHTPVVGTHGLDAETLERRFFGGNDVLFADAATSWASHVDMVEHLASLAEVMASAGGPMVRSRRSTRAAGGSVTERVAERVARLADDARVRAYEILGDRPRAVEITERRLPAE